MVWENGPRRIVLSIGEGRAHQCKDFIEEGRDLRCKDFKGVGDPYRTSLGEVCLY